MEIRPVFDGNPLSWFSNKEDIGPGYFSYGMKYFNNEKTFEETVLLDIIRYKIQKLKLDHPFFYKINMYPNAQQPGTLWYHDHAMSSTKFNVANGLFGFYLIRNP